MIHNEIELKVKTLKIEDCMEEEMNLLVTGLNLDDILEMFKNNMSQEIMFKLLVIIINYWNGIHWKDKKRAKLKEILTKYQDISVDISE